MHGPLLLLDFNNACHRAAHALREGELMDDDGKPTAVAFGVLGELSRLMQRFNTNRVIMCGDHPAGSTLRKAIHPGYKKRREEGTPEEAEFRSAVAKGMRHFRRLLRDGGYTGYFHRAGYEADDLIAAFCSAYDGQDKVIVSNDKDLYQLLDGSTNLYRPGAKNPVVTLQTFYAEYGIHANRWAEVKAIAGCSTDQVPGVRGVAEQSAVKYILGASTGKKADAIREHVKNGGYELAKRLVTLPFDDRLYNAAIYVGEDVDLFNEYMWRAVCRLAGIRSIPYPGV